MSANHPAPATEMIPSRSSLGRITAAPVLALRPVPGYDAAAMDGIAVRAAATHGVTDQRPVTLAPGTGYRPVDTGDPVPPGFDAVIRIEDLYFLPDQSVQILAPAVQFQHIRMAGEDLKRDEPLLPASHRIRPVDLGTLLAAGVSRIKVFTRPRAAVIPTGDELADPENELAPGQIPEFNSAVIAGYLSEWGTEPVVFPIALDRPADLTEAVQQALAETDLVIINAGSSAGREDFTATVIAGLGEVLVHGVATKPGKPTILGRCARKPVVGLPGYPVSAYLALEWFVRPLIYGYYGLPEPERLRIRAHAGRRIVSEPGVEEFLRVSIERRDGRYIAHPLPRGAGAISSLVRADGLLIVPANTLGYEKGEELEIELFRSEPELSAPAPQPAPTTDASGKGT